MSLRRNASAFMGAVFLAVAVSVPFSAVASAQQSGSGLQLSPTRTEISASPGDQKELTITLKNITQGNLSARAILNDFESDGVTGTPKILVDDKQRTPYSISSMIRGLRNVDIKAGETKEIKLSVDVPGNAAPGAYFGAVRFSVVPQGTEQNDRQIALNASVAHLVFVEVPGNVVQQIKVESLKLRKDNKTGSILFSAPDKADLTVRNLGNGFSRPFGTVEVKNPFGKRAASYEVNANDPRSIVLPNSSRTFTNDVSGFKFPGRYSSVASVAYGNGGEVVNYKSAFWYLPVWFLIVVAVLLLAIIGAAYYIYRKKFAKRTLSSNNPQRR